MGLDMCQCLYFSPLQLHCFLEAFCTTYKQDCSVAQAAVLHYTTVTCSHTWG